MQGVYEYEKMSRRELLRHVTAYAEAMHELAGRCMAAENRLRLIEKTRRFFEGIEYDRTPTL